MDTATTARILFTLICLMEAAITAATGVTGVPILTTPMLAIKVDLSGEVRMPGLVPRPRTVAGLDGVDLLEDPVHRRRHLLLARLAVAVRLAAAGAVSSYFRFASKNSVIDSSKCWRTGPVTPWAFCG